MHSFPDSRSRLSVSRSPFPVPSISNTRGNVTPGNSVNSPRGRLTRALLFSLRHESIVQEVRSNIEITCQNNYVLRENEMAGEGRIVFVSFWFFVRNFHTNCDDDCIKNITYDLFFLKNA